MTTQPTGPSSANPWQDRLSGRRIIAFGAGNALLGLLETSPLDFSWVVDDTPGYAGHTIAGLPIYTSDSIRSRIAGSYFVVICSQTSTGVLAISRQLMARGLRVGRDYVDCSWFQSETMAERLRAAFGLASHQELFSNTHAVVLGLRHRNLTGIAGTWLFAELVENLNGTDGAIAECGVYEGADALAALIVSSKARERPLHLYDSFEGLTALSPSDPSSRRGQFSDACSEVVENGFGEFPNVRIHRGYFSEMVPLTDESGFALVCIDCDLQEPTRWRCEHFWNRLTPGGMMLIHDYWFPSTPMPPGAPESFLGVREAVDAFLADRCAQFVVFPETSHILIRKPRAT